MNPKVDYVLRQGQTRDHACHWPGCPRQVPPALWGCVFHWKALPAFLRMRIWKWFHPGQETSQTPSREYVRVAHATQLWIEATTQPMIQTSGPSLRLLTTAETQALNTKLETELIAMGL